MAVKTCDACGQPLPENRGETPVAVRVEEVRLKAGLSLKGMHDRLTEHGYSGSYEAVRAYHKDKPPTAEYLACIQLGFRVNLNWLLTGTSRVAYLKQAAAAPPGGQPVEPTGQDESPYPGPEVPVGVPVEIPADDPLVEPPHEEPEPEPQTVPA